VLVVALAAAVLPLLGLPTTPAATATSMATSAMSTATVINRNRGVDISWPECPKDVGIPHRMGQAKPMPSGTSGFVVLGLTNGPGFHVNPCIDTQLAFIRGRHIPMAVYAMTTYPTVAEARTYGSSGPFTASTALGRLGNAAVAQARFNVATMRAKGIQVPFVWIDVESYAPWDWSKNRAANIAVLNGIVHGYRTAGYRVGFYSSVYMWSKIIGSHGPHGFPEWRTAGRTSWGAALAMCSTGSFQGGAAVMGQWWTATKDYDVVCPRSATVAGRARFIAAT
jgi:hypothetical protein